jgi:polar amino acid transport system substrate-binding protein
MRRDRSILEVFRLGSGFSLTVLFALILAACSGGEDSTARMDGSSAADNPFNLVEPGVLRVGTEPGYPPFEMKARDGSVIGYDMEIVEGFAAKHGLELEIVESEFDGLIPALQTGKIDLAISGMTIKPERAEIVDFSQPYYQVGQVILLQKKLEGTITEASQLNDPKWKIAVQTATTGQFAAEEFMPKAELLRYGTGIECANAVRQGDADAMVFDDPLIRIFWGENPDRVTALLDPFTREDLGLAVKKGNAPLREAVNAYLDEIEASGEAARLQKEYFEDLTWKEQQ